MPWSHRSWFGLGFCHQRTGVTVFLCCLFEDEVGALCPAGTGRPCNEVDVPLRLTLMQKGRGDTFPSVGIVQNVNRMSCRLDMLQKPPSAVFLNNQCSHSMHSTSLCMLWAWPLMVVAVQEDRGDTFSSLDTVQNMNRLSSRRLESSCCQDMLENLHSKSHCLQDNQCQDCSMPCTLARKIRAYLRVVVVVVA
jgi:hypothetical protein